MPAARGGPPESLEAHPHGQGVAGGEGRPGGPDLLAVVRHDRRVPAEPDDLTAFADGQGHGGFEFLQDPVVSPDAEGRASSAGRTCPGRSRSSAPGLRSGTRHASGRAGRVPRRGPSGRAWRPGSRATTWPETGRGRRDGRRSGGGSGRRRAGRPGRLSADRPPRRVHRRRWRSQPVHVQEPAGVVRPQDPAQ